MSISEVGRTCLLSGVLPLMLDMVSREEEPAWEIEKEWPWRHEENQGTVSPRKQSVLKCGLIISVSAAKGSGKMNIKIWPDALIQRTSREIFQRMLSVKM